MSQHRVGTQESFKVLLCMRVFLRTLCACSGKACVPRSRHRLLGIAGIICSSSSSIGMQDMGLHGEAVQAATLDCVAWTRMRRDTHRRVNLILRT